MTVPLRIAHGNGHNEPSLVQFARDMLADGADSVGLAEADRLIDRLRPLGRLVVTDHDGDRARDTPIIVNGRHRVLSWRADVVSRALGRPGTDLRRVAPARVLTEARYTHPLADALGLNGVCHLNLHPDAGPKQLEGRNALAPITREYRRAFRAARNSWRQAHADGYLVVLTSDAQMNSSSRRPWAPRQQARRLGAKSWSTGIDWLLFDPRLKLNGDPHTRRLFDHPGYLATLVPARKEH